MNIPGFVTLYNAIDVSINTQYRDYCNEVNNKIRDYAIRKGKAVFSEGFRGTIYRYSNDNYRYQYNDSDYGNDSYYLEIHESIWDKIPDSINRNLFNEDGFNLVYSFQVGSHGEILKQHAPGDWFKHL
ncbi:hypothetical protein [Peptoanaerobacter stomatis]